MILIALNILLGMAVLWVQNTKNSPKVPAVVPKESTKQVQGGQTSTDPWVNLAGSTGLDTALAGGRDVQVNEQMAKEAWLMKSSPRFLQDVLETGGIEVGSCRLAKVCQVIKNLHTVLSQELVLVADASGVLVETRQK